MARPTALAADALTDAAAIKAERAELLGLKALAAERRFYVALRRFIRKYREDQPRDDHGRWVYDGGRGRPSSSLGAAAAVSLPTSLSLKPGLIHVASRISPAIEAQCERQYEQDLMTCRALKSRACYAQAALRYGNCLGNKIIPPLNF
jgi:hypothetical protein